VVTSVERRLWQVLGAFAVLVAGWEAARGHLVTAIVSLTGLGALAWWMSPWRAPGGASQREVEARATDERGVVVYWRPGCPFCERLRHGLGQDGRERVTWVDIWSDPDAAAYVRSVNDGDETVPTVLADGVAHTNPDVSTVREMLRR
jgi:mycoredoxin